MLGATHAWPFISGSLEQTYGSRFIMTTRFALDVQVLTVLQVSIQVVAELSLEVRTSLKWKRTHLDFHKFVRAEPAGCMWFMMEMVSSLGWMQIHSSCCLGPSGSCSGHMGRKSA